MQTAVGVSQSLCFLTFSSRLKKGGRFGPGMWDRDFSCVRLDVSPREGMTAVHFY